jgi:hypothetical protein
LSHTFTFQHDPQLALHTASQVSGGTRWANEL